MSRQLGLSVDDGFARLTDRGQVTVLHVDDEKRFGNLVSIYVEREDSTLEMLTETAPDAAMETLETADVEFAD